MSLERKEPEVRGADVRFGTGNLIAVTGILGGVAIALAFPWMILTHGQALESKTQVLFILGALGVGGLIALVSAFFGLVIPQQVGGGAPSDWKDWADYADYGIWAEPDYRNWTLKDWKAWGQKVKEKYKTKK